MDDKLTQIEEKYDKIQAQMADPGIYEDMSRYMALAKEQKELEPVVTAWRHVQRLRIAVAEAQAMLDMETDADMLLLAQEELDSARAALPEAETELKMLLLPKDPNDSRNVSPDLRWGVGRDEAALFAARL